MIQEYKDKIMEMGNSWIFDKDYKANLLISDDLDSLMSALLLMKYRPNIGIGYFFNYKEGLYEKMGIDETLPTIGIDISLCNGKKCISNHVTKIDDDDFINPEDINLSNIDGVSAGNYHYKYNLNNLLLVYSLLDLQPQSDIEKIITLLPDSAFIPYYQPSGYLDPHIQEKYLCDIMDLKSVYEIQEKMTKEKFIEAQDALNIKSKIYVDENGINFVDNVDLSVICKYLNLEYDPSLLEGFFYLAEKYEGYTDTTAKKYDKNKIYSFAVTSRNRVKYSKKSKESEFDE